MLLFLVVFLVFQKSEAAAPNQCPWCQGGNNNNPPGAMVEIQIQHQVNPSVSSDGQAVSLVYNAPEQLVLARVRSGACQQQIEQVRFIYSQNAPSVGAWDACYERRLYAGPVYVVEGVCHGAIFYASPCGHFETIDVSSSFVDRLESAFLSIYKPKVPFSVRGSLQMQNAHSEKVKSAADAAGTLVSIAITANSVQASPAHVRAGELVVSLQLEAWLAIFDAASVGKTPGFIHIHECYIQDTACEAAKSFVSVPGLNAVGWQYQTKLLSLAPFFVLYKQTNAKVKVASKYGTVVWNTQQVQYCPFGGHHELQNLKGDSLVKEGDPRNYWTVAQAFYYLTSGVSETVQLEGVLSPGETKGPSSKMFNAIRRYFVTALSYLDPSLVNLANKFRGEDFPLIQRPNVPFDRRQTERVFKQALDEIHTPKGPPTSIIWQDGEAPSKDSNTLRQIGTQKSGSWVAGSVHSNSPSNMNFGLKMGSSKLKPRVVNNNDN